MRQPLHPAVFLAGALLFSVVWLWVRPELPLPLLELPGASGSGAEIYRRHEAIVLDAVALERYVGSYEVAAGLVVEITREGGRLLAKPEGSLPIELLPYSETEFFSEGARIEVEFATDEGGRVQGLVARTPNGALPATRVR